MATLWMAQRDLNDLLLLCRYEQGRHKVSYKNTRVQSYLPLQMTRSHHRHHFQP